MTLFSSRWTRELTSRGDFLEIVITDNENLSVGSCSYVCYSGLGLVLHISGLDRPGGSDKESKIIRCNKHRKITNP